MLPVLSVFFKRKEIAHMSLREMRFVEMTPSKRVFIEYERQLYCFHFEVQ